MSVINPPERKGAKRTSVQWVTILTIPNPSIFCGTYKVNFNLTNFYKKINYYFEFILQPTTGYYDPNNQFAATSLGAAVANRDAGQNSNIASQLAGLVSSASSVTGGAGNGNSSSAVNTLGSTSGFGSTSGATSTAAVAAAAASAAAASSALAVNNAADSTSSPGPATSTGSSQMTGSGQHHSVQQQAQQQQQQQQQTAFNLAATNAFAAQQMPPGYAYYFGNMGNMSLQGYPQTPQGHVYQPQAMTVPGQGTTPSQFQKQTYGTRYDIN